jgi:hypothetical protein
MTVRILIRYFLAWIALLAAQMVAGMLIPIRIPERPHLMEWFALSEAVIVACLVAAAVRSDWRDWTLARALFFIAAAIPTVNMIEGAVFLPNVQFDWRRLIALTLVTYLLAAVLWFAIFRSAPILKAQVEAELPHRTWAQKAWRFVACSAIYVFLYYLAGMIIFPYVRDFYATQRIPAPMQIVSLQFFLRGPVFILVCLTLLRMFRLSHFAGALAVGVTFTLLSGVAPLIVPSTVFPDAVRWVHFGEVTSSNLVFGFVVGWIWGHAKPVSQLQHAHA